MTMSLSMERFLVVSNPQHKVSHNIWVIWAMVIMHVAAPEVVRMGVIFSYIHNLDISEFNQVKPVVPNWQNIFWLYLSKEQSVKLLYDLKRFFEYEVTGGLEGKLKIDDDLSHIEIEIHGNQTFPRIIPTALRVNYTYSLVSINWSKNQTLLKFKTFCRLCP